MKRITKILILSLVSIIGSSSAIFGATITKTFELGEGTAFQTSSRRDFKLPCYRSAKATVKFSRLGKQTPENDVALRITLTSPTEGEIGSGEVVDTKEVTAKTTVQTVELSNVRRLEIPPLGCNFPWSVRVSRIDLGPQVKISGEIQVSFNDDTIIFYPPDGYQLNLDSGVSQELEITKEGGRYSTLLEGNLEITGNWFHNLYTLPIKMRVELINPNGESVATAEGFSRGEVNPCCNTQKLKLNYRIKNFIPGKWKIKVTNISNGHDAILVNFKATSSPGCP